MDGKLLVVSRDAIEIQQLGGDLQNALDQPFESGSLGDQTGDIIAFGSPSASLGVPAGVNLKSLKFHCRLHVPGLNDNVDRKVQNEQSRSALCEPRFP